MLPAESESDNDAFADIKVLVYCQVGNSSNVSIC